MNYYIIEKRYYDDDRNEHFYLYDEIIYKTWEKAQEFIDKRHLEDCVITELTLIEDDN